MYVAATQYILGVKPVLEGLSIDPCIPADWEGFAVKRRFRGCVYDITVTNASKVSKGVQKITVNGEPIEGNVLPPYPGRQSVKVEVTL
ncbi:N,N'-diacetylchitobiose phosphorylase [compost metagenome]